MGDAAFVSCFMVIGHGVAFLGDGFLRRREWLTYLTSVLFSGRYAYVAVFSIALFSAYCCSLRYGGNC